MTKNLIWLFIILIGFGRVLGQNHQITVTVKGLHNNKGKVILYLFNSEAGYPQDRSKAFKTASAIITNNTCAIVLSEIPAGTYAIGCFHDENDNGKLDTNLLGIPTEGVGASNNAKGSFGPPKFKDAKFMVEKDMAMTITVSH